MDANVWVAPCIEANLSNLTLTTKCIKNSASSLLSVAEHAELIAKIWLQNFETASEPATQLALFYVLNEVLQNCISYGAPEMKNTFKTPIMSALKSFRPGMPIDKVKKLLLVWGQQGLFEKDFNKRLLKYARHFENLSKRPDTNVNHSNAKDFKDFSPDKLIRQLREYAEIETNSKIFEPEFVSSLLGIPIETTLSRIKSKAEGISFSKDVRNCADQLDSTLNDLSRKLAAQEALVKNIDKAMLFYLAQEKDARSVVNAYKLYEQQIRETLRSVGGSYISTVKAAPDDDIEYSCQNIYEDGGGGGGDSDMSDIEEIENIPLHHPRVEPITPSRSVSDLLVDPKTLSDLPFSEYITIDDSGDVDYRPMLSKILENNSNKSKEIDPPQLIQTETGDFDYRKPPPPAVVVDEDQRKPQPIDPFGLGTHEDADLRQLKPSVFSQPPVPPIIPETPSDSDYRQLQLPHLQSTIIPPTSHAYPWLNITDSDLRQSSVVSGDTLISSLPVAVANTVTLNHTSPFNVTLPPPSSKPSASVRPQAEGIPPFQTVLSPLSSAQTTVVSHPHISLQSTYQPQQQQNPLISQIPNISEAVLSTLQRTSSLESLPVTAIQPVYQSSSSTKPITTQSKYNFPNEVVTTVASNNAVDNIKSQEDPFSIIFRITGLSDLIKSAKSCKTVADGNSPATPVTPIADTTPTPTYAEGVEGEKKASGEIQMTQASGSSSSYTPHQQTSTTQDAEEDEGQSDGGATPIQDESEIPNDAPPVTSCFAFSQTGPMNFPPPPIQTTSTVSSNLLVNIPPMSLPPTFNPMNQPPWHTGLPPGLSSLDGGRPPQPQAFFFAFPPSMLSRPPNFSNLPNSQGHQ
nr:hypothetical transcript [Hymenolepis microstoma]